MKILKALALWLAFMGLLSAIASANTPIDVVAANWKFAPAAIVVHVDQPVTLHLTSSEGVHGIKSDELGIKQTMILPGKFVDVTFTPKKAGTYVIACSLICGAGHSDMKLTVKVES
jgi:cytochrome c oxidase subunit 2